MGERIPLGGGSGPGGPWTALYARISDAWAPGGREKGRCVR